MLPHADILPPSTVLEIVSTLQRAGFETWCVGGAVRDALLGHVHLDWDLATAATPPQVRRLFARTVPVGIEFGTIGVIDRHGHMHEVTTFRRDVQHDGRHAVVEFGASLDEDLARRDFTINAVAFDPIAKQLHDPFGGRADVEARLVRAVGDPDARMQEDRLRALRAIRFSSRFEFALDPATWRAIVDSAPFLSRLSPERVKQEIDKTMEQVRRPSQAFARWRDAGAFASLVPALAGISDVVLAALDLMPMPGPSTRPQRKLLRIAALFSDLDGRATEDALRALRFSNQEIAWVSTLVGRWHTTRDPLTTRMIDARPLDAREVRRLAAVIGRLRVGSFSRLAAARWGADESRGTAAAPLHSRRAGLHRALLRSASLDPLEVADLALDGDDLRSLGIPPGPQYGRILSSLLDEVLDDPRCNTHAVLSARVLALSAPLR